MILEIKDLCMTYPGGKKALDHLNLTLEPGIYGLLGENGAGKSTLMNILTCNLKQTGGTICYEGKDIREHTQDYVKRIGYMPQQQGLYRSMTAVQFLTYMSNLKGIKKNKAKEQIPMLLEKVNLSSVYNKKLGSFSGGMKQRILIAQAMLGNPQVLIFDEPTAGLDPKERIRVRNLISELSFEKIVIIATHVVTDVEFISRELLILKQGHLIRQGSNEDLTAELEDLVYEIPISKECYKKVEKELLVSSIRSDQDNVYLRVVGNPETIRKYVGMNNDMKKMRPELDDLYLYLFKE